MYTSQLSTRTDLNPLDRFANCVFCGGHTVFCVVVVMKAEDLRLGTDNLCLSPLLPGRSVEYLSTRVWDVPAGKGWLIVSHDPTTNMFTLILPKMFDLQLDDGYLYSQLIQDTSNLVWLSNFNDNSNLRSCDNIKLVFKSRVLYILSNKRDNVCLFNLKVTAGCSWRINRFKNLSSIELTNLKSKR